MVRKKILIVVCLLLLTGGCMKWFMTSTGGPIDPNTDPNDIVLSPTGQRVESGLEAGADIAKGVSIFWPPAALIAGLLTSGVAAIKKYKPQLATAETQRDQFYNVTNALVFAIEKLKEDYPEDWESHLEPILKKHIDPNGSIEAVIRAIRGLPVKT